MAGSVAILVGLLLGVAVVAVVVVAAWGRASKRRRQPALRPVTHQEVQAALRGDEFNRMADPAWARAWRDDPTAPKEKR